MNLRLSLTFWCYFFLLCTLFSQRKYDYYDGPYLEVNGDSIAALWIANGKLNRSTDPFVLPYTFAKDSLPKVQINDPDPQVEPFERYTGVKKFIALSDVHGQHHIMIKLLKKHEVIDSN